MSAPAERNDLIGDAVDSVVQQAVDDAVRYTEAGASYPSPGARSLLSALLQEAIEAGDLPAPTAPKKNAADKSDESSRPKRRWLWGRSS